MKKFKLASLALLTTISTFTIVGCKKEEEKEKNVVEQYSEILKDDIKLDGTLTLTTQEIDLKTDQVTGEPRTVTPNLNIAYSLNKFYMDYSGQKKYYQRFNEEDKEDESESKYVGMTGTKVLYEDNTINSLIWNDPETHEPYNFDDLYINPLISYPTSAYLIDENDPNSFTFTLNEGNDISKFVQSLVHLNNKFESYKFTKKEDGLHFLSTGSDVDVIEYFGQVYGKTKLDYSLDLVINKLDGEAFEDVKERTAPKDVNKLTQALEEMQEKRKGFKYHQKFKEASYDQTTFEPITIDHDDDVISFDTDETFGTINETKKTGYAKLTDGKVYNFTLGDDLTSFNLTNENIVALDETYGSTKYYHNDFKYLSPNVYSENEDGSFTLVADDRFRNAKDNNLASAGLANMIPDVISKSVVDASGFTDLKITLKDGTDNKSHLDKISFNVEESDGSKSSYEFTYNLTDDVDLTKYNFNIDNYNKGDVDKKLIGEWQITSEEILAAKTDTDTWPYESTGIILKIEADSGKVCKITFNGTLLTPKKVTYMLDTLSFTDQEDNEFEFNYSKYMGYTITITMKDAQYKYQYSLEPKAIKDARTNAIKDIEDYEKTKQTTIDALDDAKKAEVTNLKDVAINNIKKAKTVEAITGIVTKYKADLDNLLK